MKTPKWLGLLVAAAVLMCSAAESAEPDHRDWEVSLHPHVWLPSLDADTGVGDVSSEMDVSSTDVLKELEGGLMLNLEARRDRWGVLLHGMYSKVSADSPSPGPFFNLIDTTFDTGELDAALFFRVTEGGRGWVDVLAGARWMHFGIEYEMTPDYEAADDISASIVGEVTGHVQSGVSRAVSGAADHIADVVAELPTGEGEAARTIYGSRRVRESVSTDEVLQRIDRRVPTDKGIDVSYGGGRGTVAGSLRTDLEGRVERSSRKLAQAIQAAIAEGAGAKVDLALADLGPNPDPADKAGVIRKEIRHTAGATLDQLKRNASPKTAKAIQQAEDELTAAIGGAMVKAADAHVKESRDWVAPFAGVRGRLNLTQRVFAGARADVGGWESAAM
jgi:hypothetical protein